MYLYNGINSSSIIYKIHNVIKSDKFINSIYKVLEKRLNNFSWKGIDSNEKRLQYYFTNGGCFELAKAIRNVCNFYGEDIEYYLFIDFECEVNKEYGKIYFEQLVKKHSLYHVSIDIPETNYIFDIKGLREKRLYMEGNTKIGFQINEFVENIEDIELIIGYLAHYNDSKIIDSIANIIKDIIQ